MWNVGNAACIYTLTSPVSRMNIRNEPQWKQQMFLLYCQLNLPSIVAAVSTTCSNIKTILYFSCLRSARNKQLIYYESVCANDVEALVLPRGGNWIFMY
jgi:alanine dehydrogenase